MLSHRWPQRLAALALIGAGLGLAAWLHGYQQLEWTPDALRTLVAGMGPTGPLLLIAIMALRPFLALPSWLVLGVAGLLFGPIGGTLYGALGGALGAALLFFIARSLGRDAIQARLGLAFERVDAYLMRRGAPWLAAYTAVPISPLTPVFFCAGVTSMRLSSFCAATALGFLPRAGVFAFAGQTVAEPTSGNLLLLSAMALLAVPAAWLAHRQLGPKPTAPPPAQRGKL